jgi:signal transduction histidine kinase
VGVTPDEVDHIFERFHRVSSNSAVEGSGLGLSIVGAIAKAHGGIVDVESDVGVGTTFTITLPMPNSRSLVGLGAAHRDEVRSGS